MAKNLDITDEMTKTVAGRASFNFQINLRDETGYEGYEGNDFVIPGEGVADLDGIIRIFGLYPRARIRLDYGGFVEDYRDIGVENVEDLKTAYIAIWGDVNRPNVWDTPDSYLV